MFDRDDDVVERVVRQLRQPVSIDRALDERVMAEIAEPPRVPARRWSRGAWGGLAAAAALGAILVARPWRAGTGGESALDAGG